ncbi:MAG: phosphatidylglycerophosphatase A [Elusimicrobia bacterium]|nr:phosphatidylglycerophosphatase A [Elusimicrobiota bacterium]
MKWLIRFIATGFFVGEKFPAPGTAASILSAAIYFFILPTSHTFYWTMLILLTFIGVITAGRTEEMMGEIDPPQIVIDEIVGFLVAMAFLPKSLGLILIGLVIFRFFDIVKVYPMNKLQIVAGGLGIMLDDLYAGVITNLILRIIHTL